MNVDNNSMELEMELWNYKHSYLVIAKRAGPRWSQNLVPGNDDIYYLDFYPHLKDNTYIDL